MKKILSVVISIAMLMTALIVPAGAAVSNKYQTPTILPPANTHPRVMLRNSDISEIKENMSTSQNSAAKTKFESLIADSFTSTGLSTGFLVSENYDFNVENRIEAFAFDYVINGNTASGETAIDRMIEYLEKVKYASSTSLRYRFAGVAVFHAAEVYDWCYPLLSDSEKETIISKCESLLSSYLECGYPPTSQSSIVSHGSEAQILRDMLAFAIAVYDERPDIYNAVMGRIQEEMVPARNDLYRSGTIHQGTEYGWYRFYWDLYAQTLVDRMSEGKESLFDKELMSDVLYSMIYSRRPDGRFFTEGDNKQTHYWYYNNFNQMTAKLAGDLFDDPYFKGEYRMMRGEENFDNNNFTDERSFNSVNWLIMNNPDVAFTVGTGGGRNSLAKSKYMGSPIGKIYARTEWAYSKSSPATLNVAAAEMKIGERYSANHDHLDAGTFQLYYRGLLTGDYGAEDDYNSDFDLDYYKRTVAHNALTIYDSGESFRFEILGTARANDGGQMPATTEPDSFSEWVNNSPYKRAAVVNQSVAADNSYSYIKGDITPAYSSSKASEVARSMAFLPTGNSSQPAVMVVYDKVTSKTASQTKKFLLHTGAEPTVDGSKTTVVNQNTLEYSNGSATYDGKLTVNTLLPANPTITKVSGCQVGSKNYTAPMSDSKYEPEWGRLEIQAAAEGTTTQFLNVLTVSNTSTTPADSVIIGNENSRLVGTQTPYDQVVMFANTGKASLDVQADFDITSGEDLDFYIFGVGEGRWTVRKDGDIIAIRDVNAIDGTVSFNIDGDASGTYTVAPFDGSDIDFSTVLWYDYRASDGVSQNSSATSWYDLSGQDNNLAMPVNAQWTQDGLLINSNNNNVQLPAIAKDTVNGNQYTIEFAVSDITIPDAAKSLSILGNVKKNFAIHKIIGADKIYVKLPGWKSTLRRPFLSVGDFDDNHHIITVDKSRDVMKWYVNGELIVQKPYEYEELVGDINLISGTGSATYKQIKFLNVAITASDAQNEYSAYTEGF